MSAWITTTRRNFKDEQKSADDEIADKKAFARDYVHRRRRIDDSKMAAAGAKAKAKVMKKRVAPPAGHIPQKVAKTFLPKPGASIWRNNTKGEHGWCAHVPPRSRISEPFDGDEHKSLQVMLKRSWCRWLEIKAKSWDVCPWEFHLLAVEAPGDV